MRVSVHNMTIDPPGPCRLTTLVAKACVLVQPPAARRGVCFSLNLVYIFYPINGTRDFCIFVLISYREGFPDPNQLHWTKKKPA